MTAGQGYSAKDKVACCYFMVSCLSIPTAGLLLVMCFLQSSTFFTV